MQRTLASTPFANARDYFQTLVSSGVPFDTAIQAASAMRAMQGYRTLSPAEVAAHGYRQGTVVQEQPGGEDRIVQQSDVKSPEAIAQEFAVAREMPMTQAQQEKLDILRGRYGLPPLRVPQQTPTAASPGNVQAQSAASIPVIANPEDALKLPRGQYFRTPDGQLKRVP